MAASWLYIKHGDSLICYDVGVPAGASGAAANEAGLTAWAARQDFCAFGGECRDHGLC